MPVETMVVRKLLTVKLLTQVTTATQELYISHVTLFLKNPYKYYNYHVYCKKHNSNKSN